VAAMTYCLFTSSHCCHVSITLGMQLKCNSVEGTVYVFKKSSGVLQILVAIYRDFLSGMRVLIDDLILVFKILDKSYEFLQGLYWTHILFIPTS
jgi:hypothetical protein